MVAKVGKEHPLVGMLLWVVKNEVLTELARLMIFVENALTSTALDVLKSIRRKRGTKETFV